MVRDLHTPFGFDQGDPLIICRNEVHMLNVQEAFRIKGYYCGRGAFIGGRRHSKIIVFDQGPLSDCERIAFERWLREAVVCKLDKEGRVYHV